MFHADGSLAEGPIAGCEVQGYVYGAKLLAHELALALGELDYANHLLTQAQQLRKLVEKHFWIDELTTYALALDGEKRPLSVRSSNAGHLLFTGLPNRPRAKKLQAALLNRDFTSGWGIRTIPDSSVRYNPMSYHNGSVWPHDNSIIAAGFSRYGYTRSVLPVLEQLFDVSLSLKGFRLPELWCGFPRGEADAPTLYPVACSPQAWSAGAVFLLLQSCLGLEIDAEHAQVRFRNPTLPDFLSWVRMERLRVGAGEIDLTLERHQQDVSVNIGRRSGNVGVMILK